MPADQTDDFATAVAEGRIHHEDGRLVVDPPEPAAGTHPPVQDVDELHARYTPPGQGGWTGLNADLADRVAATEAERDQARRDLDYARAAGNVYRRQYLQARAELATLRQALAQCEQLLGEARSGARRASVERDQVRAELSRIAAIGDARVRNWVCPVPGHSNRRAPNGDPVLIVEWDEDGTAYCLAPGCDRTSAETPAAPVPATGAQGAAAPAVDPAQPRTTPAEGDRIGGADHGPQEAAEGWEGGDTADGYRITVSRLADGDGDLTITVDDPKSQAIARLTPAAAASLHAWLGQHLGTAPSTPNQPTPGPQDIPQEWITAILAAELATPLIDDVEQRFITGQPHVGRDILRDLHHRLITAGHRTGYASALGYEITVSPEGDAVHIGDRWPDVDTEPVLLTQEHTEEHYQLAPCVWLASEQEYRVKCACGEVRGADDRDVALDLIQLHILCP